MAAEIPVHADLRVDGKVIGIHQGDGSGLTGITASVPIGPNVPTGTVLRQYVFTAGAESWVSSNSIKLPVSWNATDKSLECSTTDAETFSYAYEPAGVGNVAVFELEADLTILSGTSAGLLFNIADSNNYAMVVIVNDAGQDPGVYLISQSAGYSVVSENRKINFGSTTLPVRILIRRIDNKVSVYVNSTFAFTATLPTATKNVMGFTSIDGSARLDNLRVYTNVDPYRPVGGVSVYAKNVAVDSLPSNLPGNAQDALDHLSNALVGLVGKRNFIVSGGQVGSSAGMTVTISPATYYINGKLYTSPEQNVTLTNGPSTSNHGRLDVIALTTSGTAVVIEGVESTQPLVKPSFNESILLEVVTLAVSWNAVNITISRDLILPEAFGTWVVASNSSSFNALSTTLPRTGTKAIEVTNPANLDFISITTPGSRTLTQDMILGLYINRKEAEWGGRYYTVQLKKSGQVVTKEIAILDGSYGFSLSRNGYQQVIIPAQELSPLGTVLFDEVLIRHRGTGAPSGSGIFIDDIYVAQFSDQPVKPLASISSVNTDNNNIVVYGANQPINFKGTNGLTTSGEGNTVVVSVAHNNDGLTATGNMSYVVTDSDLLSVYMSGNTTLNIGNPKYQGQELTLMIVHDGTSTLTITNVNFPTSISSTISAGTAGTYSRLELQGMPSGIFDAVRIVSGYPYLE